MRKQLTAFSVIIVFVTERMKHAPSLVLIGVILDYTNPLVSLLCSILVLLMLVADKMLIWGAGVTGKIMSTTKKSSLMTSFERGASG